MIKILNGVRETVSYDVSKTLMLYHNDEKEEYPFHWHTPIEVIMPLRNGYHVELPSDVHYHLREHDIIFLRPGSLHKLYEQEGERIIFQFNMNLLNAHDEFDDFFPSSTPALLITPEDHPEIHEQCVKLMLEIEDEYLSNAPLKDASVYGKLLDLLVLIYRNTSNTNVIFSDVKLNKQKEYLEKFVSITDYIKQHCNEDISLDDVAEISGFSKYHFSRLFKEFSGTSYYKYLNQKRIEFAEQLLLDPEINITEAAVRSGFNSISAFISMFKQIKGCTPTEFRNMYSY